MQFGEVVTYTRNGVQRNALVLDARTINQKEVLTLGYLVGSGSRAELAKAFDIPPLQEGGQNGWTPTFQPPVHPWEETAAEFARNADYYRGLVVEIGELFGEEAYVADDGSLQQDVLCAKVPQLVRAMVHQAPAAPAEPEQATE